MILNNQIKQELELLAGDSQADIAQVIYPQGGDYAEFIVASRPDDYSASRIARAVEDCDLHLVNLNLTSARTPQGDLIVLVRTEACVTDRVEHSLSRYGYRVLAGYGSIPALDDSEAERRAGELLRLLEI